MSERFGVDGLDRAELLVECKGGRGAQTELCFSVRGLRSSLNLGETVCAQLHWACLGEGGAWEAPSEQPQGSHAVDPVASRMPMDGGANCRFVFQAGSAPSKMVFVLLVEKDGHQHWLKSSGGKDFVVDVARLAESAAPVAFSPKARSAEAGAAGAAAGLRVAERPAAWPALEAAKAALAEAAKGAPAKKKIVRRTKPSSGEAAKAPDAAAEGAFDVEGDLGSLKWQTVRSAQSVDVFLEASLLLPADADLLLHWGCIGAVGGEWAEPASKPAGTTPVGDGKASRSPFEGQARLALSFPLDSAPGGLAFVLYATAGGAEQWLKTSGGGDFCVPVAGLEQAAEGGTEDIDRKFSDAETKYSHWSQFQRICLANEVLSAPELDAKQAAWLATVLRLANNKKLEWYRNRGYQPKDMAHAQEALGGALAAKTASAVGRAQRVLLRLCAPAVPRGNSGGGDAIRHGILNIMRTHGIKEGHRPGIDCQFIGQWHQKLHTNSAPDDIIICEGYLRFLGSGNPEDMFGHLHNCGITREDLGKMCTMGFVDHTKSGRKGLNVNPLHLPQLTHDMNGYLNLLKHVHGGTDLFSLCEACKGQYPDHGAECMAFEIFHARDDPFTMGKIVELRRRLEHSLGKRDVLMLDVAMEEQQRSLAERTRLADLGRDPLLDYLKVLLQGLALSRREPSLDHGVALFERLARDGEKWGAEWCKLMHAACDRLSLVVTSTIDEVVSLLQGCADKLREAGAKSGAVFAPDEKVLEAFGEETGRCLTERVVAQALKCLMPQLRRGAGLGPWEVVSQGGGGGAVGKVAVMAALPAAVEPAEAPMVAVVETMTGWEDIPAGIVALLLPASQAVDTLSHVAIRARNQRVLLASCDDDAQLEALRAAKGSRLRVEVSTQGVEWRTATEKDQGGKAAQQAQAPVQVKVAKPPPPPAAVLPSKKFIEHRKCLGGKSLHLAELAPKDGAYQVPQSVTVPFGMFEKALAADENADVREELQELCEEGDWAAARECIVSYLAVPAEVEQGLAAELRAAGAPALPSSADAWGRALKGVWASKWSERAVSSRRQMQIPDSALFLAVLCQPLFPSAYAFVIHTRSPLPGAKADEQLIELCVGLGESLVSNSPGRALSASVGPSGTPVVVHTYPSKPDGVFAPEGGSHIFRSDSNGEDLEGFAGAGLYDSITVVGCTHQPVNYAEEPLLFDSGKREALLRRLFDLGRAVEANFKGQAQDIEGAVGADGSLVVTQSRPQV